MKLPRLEVYTDGACEPNPGPGGWAFVVYENEREIHHAFGYESGTTNNRMEMNGVLQAILWLAANHSDRSVQLFSDSMYCVNGCNIWRHSWKSKGWKRGKQEVANLDLWKAIDEALGDALKLEDISVRWVKGHAGNSGNERADELSYQAARSGGAKILDFTAGDYLTAEFRRVMAD
jgi:ribonuclease HI